MALLKLSLQFISNPSVLFCKLNLLLQIDGWISFGPGNLDGSNELVVLFDVIIEFDISSLYLPFIKVNLSTRQPLPLLL